MKVLPFDQSSRPAARGTSAPASEADTPDADPPRPRATPSFGDDPNNGHAHDEPGYGHGV